MICDSHRSSSGHLIRSRIFFSKNFLQSQYPGINNGVYQQYLMKASPIHSGCVIQTIPIGIATRIAKRIKTFSLIFIFSLLGGMYFLTFLSFNYITNIYKSQYFYKKPAPHLTCPQSLCSSTGRRGAICEARTQFERTERNDVWVNSFICQPRYFLRSLDI